ncbi:LPS-assembly protein LptD [Robertkochia marina]|uniref:LPS-assembly protein LptD n=1 Tax=Robertkochia marina TaxID=1227945 RepID=A0A4S3LZ17_9FLAO|nr:LPS-assembly protein LptD [Robertkochia marina]TRZ42402.1 LPS-assembly protein LptD [Robertkochia marina]
MFFNSVIFAQETPVKPLRPAEAEKDTLNISLPASSVPQVIQDSTATDSIKQPPGYIAGDITYTAKDYMQMSRGENKIFLYNEAEVYYQDYELKAGVIVIDYNANEVYAGRIKDSLGNYTQTPYFKQGNNVVEPDSIRFNFDTKRALIFNSRSEQSLGEAMNLYANTVKKENDSVYFLKDGKLTTSENSEDPDYYIRVRNGKFVPNKKIIAGFSNMYIADVPTPIAVPFAYFPLNRETSASGIILPTPGQTNLRGYALQNGGYYFSINDYVDLALLGDYYTNGSYGVRVESSYAKRYKFRGALRFRYENLINSQRGFPDYNRSTIYNLQWNHNQDAKANPNSRLAASVNFGSSQYFQQSINQINTGNFLNNTLQSSVSYNKTFPGYPMVNLNLTSSVTQNTQTQSVNLTLPTLQASMERIFPFANRSGTKKGIIQNINFQYTGRGENRIATVDSLLFTDQMFDDAKVGFRHTIPVSTNFKLFKHFSTSMSFNYNETWQLKTIDIGDYNQELQLQPRDTISGFDRFATYNFNASVGTTLYGTFNFNPEGKIQAIRHTIRPNIGYGYAPAFDQYYDEYIDQNGDVRQFTRFEGGLFGTPGLNNSNNLNFAVSNVVEAKVRDRDTTKLEPKKIKLLNNLNFSTSYNLAIDSLNWSPLRMSGNTQLLNNKMSVNFGATFDPYALDNAGNRIDVFNLENGGSIFRITQANVNVSYSIDNSTFSSERELDDNTDSGGRPDDLFGSGRDFSDKRTFGREREDSGSDEPMKLYSAKVPWNFRMAYAVTYSNNRRQNEITNNSLMVSGNVDLTPKWRVGISSGYDFKQKGVTYTQFRFDRMMDSWQMNFQWVPFSSRASWFFTIGLRSSLLSDLKWEQRREPDRRL